MSTAIAPPPRDEAVLTHGQVISRADFYRITEADPDRYRHIERIDGKVYVNASAVRREGHSKPHARLVALLSLYEAETPGTEVGDNGTAQIQDDHDPQPDCYLLILPDCGGQTEFTDDDYSSRGHRCDIRNTVGRAEMSHSSPRALDIRGAPELIAEIAGSSLRKDLGLLKEIYESDGCREYLVWSTDGGRFHCFRSGPEGFVDAEQTDGVFRSKTFPGLWIDTASLLRGDLPGAMKTVREGIAS